MRTEEDIRAALLTLETAAPDAEAGRDVGQGHRTVARSVGRRRMLVASAAVLTAAAIAVPTLFRSTEKSPVTIPSLPDAPWRHSFHLQLPKSYQYGGLEQHQLYRDRERTDVQPPQGSGCIVEVYRRGAFDPSVIPPGATPVTVNGNPGYFASFRLPSDWVIDRPPRIAWRYATDSWAVTSCKDAEMTNDLRGNEQAIAESVVFERQPFLVPFTVEYLPEGFHVQRATAKRPHTWTVGQARIPERYPPLVTISASRDGDANRPDAQSVAIEFRQDDLTKRATGDESVTVNGRPAFLRSDRFGTTLVIPGDGYEFAVGVRAGVLGTPAQTEQQLVAVAEGLRLAERPLDDTSWFDGSTALAR